MKEKEYTKDNLIGDITLLVQNKGANIDTCQEIVSLIKSKGFEIVNKTYKHA